MAQNIKMSRGQLHDLLSKFATENPKYREALLRDPKGTLEKQLNTSLGSVQVKTVTETSDVIYVVVPPAPAKDGQLSDKDLEKVAGGFLDNLAASCTMIGGSIGSNVAIEF